MIEILLVWKDEDWIPPSSPTVSKQDPRIRLLKVIHEECHIPLLLLHIVSLSQRTFPSPTASNQAIQLSCAGRFLSVVCRFELLVRVWFVSIVYILVVD